MENFTFYTPTKIYFGKDQIKHLRDEVVNYGQKVLLVYGGGSIKRNGIYDAVVKQLDGLTLYELSGVQPNPRLESVEEGVALCHKYDIEVVLAVGGGSSIDCAKAICAAACSELSAWALIEKPQLIKAALPLISVLTIAATGSEMDNTGVITNPQLKLKKGFGNDLLAPKASILDPTYTYTLPPRQSAAGVADIMSHIIESYFNKTEGTYIQSQISIALLKTCIKYGPKVISDPEDYEARANLMWASSLAINGLTSAGAGKHWSCHPMQHILSAYYDCTHGEALAILTPAWMQYILNETTATKISEYAREVFNIDESDDFKAALAGINQTRVFFKDLGLATSLTQIGVDAANIDTLAQGAVAAKGGKISGFVTLEKEDVAAIYRSCAQ